MAERDAAALTLENRHTGERLSLRRVRRGSEVWLEMKGTVPPHGEGPPLHIHLVEDEDGNVRAGTLSAVMNGQPLTIAAGGSTAFPRGAAHRWWNAGDATLEFDGHSGPLVDLDLYLQAMFEVLNAGPPGRPPLFYMAHVAWRHRHTQVVLVMPRGLQAMLFPVIIAIGTVLGRYRGSDWPGAPARCVGAPSSE